jgi:hypothetical protein
VRQISEEGENRTDGATGKVKVATKSARNACRCTLDISPSRPILWPDSEAPTAGPAGPLAEVDLPCRRSEWHGSF